ncbi:MAG: LysR substrate-binding domain-containing protein [Beijerinckiaceae bacterium]|nr:LysR substrate-binding domain-containing protein [Beijerinckiaceae bacterium]
MPRGWCKLPPGRRPDRRSTREDTINLRQLTYFLRVVEAGNMTAAAEQLNLAQPALGAQMRQLEKELGVELLVRHSRGVSPTEAGRRLSERAKALLRDVEDMRREVQAIGTVAKDSIVLGLAPSIMLLIGPDVLLEARNEMPEVFFSLSEERSSVLAEALERGQLDVILAYNIGPRAGFERQAILEEDFLLVTAPERAPASSSVSLAEALEMELVIGGERGVLRSIVEAEAQRLSLKLRLAFEVHSINSMKSLITRGVGASIMPYSLASEELKRGSLIGRRIDRPAITRTLYAVQPAARRAAAHDQNLKHFMDKLEAKILAALGPFGRPLK